MLNKLNKIIFAIAGVIIFVPFLSFAQTSTPTSTSDSVGIMGRLKGVAVGGGYSDTTNNTSAIKLISLAINAFLALLGIIFIVLILLAGYNWMTAQGDASKVEKAQHTMQYAIIGLVIIVGSFAIWNFINSALISLK